MLCFVVSKHVINKCNWVSLITLAIYWEIIAVLVDWLLPMITLQTLWGGLLHQNVIWLGPIDLISSFVHN